MTETKRKVLYWVFKALSVFVACALPIWAVVEKFPMWEEKHGPGIAYYAGIAMIGIVLLIVFRRSVFNFLVDKFNLSHAPPIMIWGVLLVVSYSMKFISTALADMNIIFWMGMLGCAIGSLLTYIAENCFGKKVTGNE